MLFVILGPPPIPTLFPYTTLFRSEKRGLLYEDVLPRLQRLHREIEMKPWRNGNDEGVESRIGDGGCVIWIDPLATEHPRSEEHTSELQSRLHLVCRLLLEKKKTKP